MQRRPTVRSVAALIALMLGTSCTAGSSVNAGDAGAAGTTAAPSTTSDAVGTSEPQAPTSSTPSPADRTTAPTTATTPPPAESTAAPSTRAPVPAFDPGPITWSSCGEDLDCATVVVPLDYADPQGPTASLNVVRANATDPSSRIGSMLVNPGGPGAAGTYLARQARFFFTDRLRERFDIVAWDPRGTGRSIPSIDCVNSYDEYFTQDVTPDDAAEQQALEAAAAAFRDACAAHNSPDALANVSTEQTARDMDALRRALGEDTITYFGFSYGSELGSVWLTLFPETVRAAALDGALNPNYTKVERSLAQASGFEIALNAFLEDCGGDCAFDDGDDPGAAFDRIVADIDGGHYPTAPGRPELTQGITYTAVIDALYAKERWPALEEALDDASKGDGAALLALYDEYYERQPDGSYSNLLESFTAIDCVDDPGPQTIAGVDEYNDEYLAIAPRIGPAFTHGYSCVGWPAAAPALPRIDGAGAGPVVVVGTTNDPASPFESSKSTAEALEGGVFVAVTGEGHLGYAQSACAQDIVDAYLINLDVPDSDVVCD
jgi:pimeloyl-ACP methyl ester carboxylesterase